jgi:hypothetical protein
MLNHPWLDMQDNYEFKYTDREYDVMMLKKEFKNQMKGGNNAQQEDTTVEDRQEMNELIDSDPELYAADVEKYELNKKGNVINQSNSNTRDSEFDLFNDDEISLEDPEEAREKYRVRKEEESKIHNSFTGPYPLDPTEFSHTDKGANDQFTTLV